MLVEHNMLEELSNISGGHDRRRFELGPFRFIVEVERKLKKRLGEAEHGRR